jgi:hypothetical protein
MLLNILLDYIVEYLLEYFLSIEFYVVENTLYSG